VKHTSILRVVTMHRRAMNDRWLFLAGFCLLLLHLGQPMTYWLVSPLQAVLAGRQAGP